LSKRGGGKKEKKACVKGVNEMCRYLEMKPPAEKSGKKKRVIFKGGTE